MDGRSKRTFRCVDLVIWRTVTMQGDKVADDLRYLQQVRGHVKWFDPAKGFGFIVADEGGADILLHVNVLRNFGQSSVADGARIEVVTHRTERGVQAAEILSIEPPSREMSPVLPDLAETDPAVLENLPIEPARVKWFDKGKGFGFANIFGLRDDIFLHIEVLRRSGLSDLQPGEALALRVVEGKRGRMAVEVFAWDAVPQLKDNP